MKKIIILRNSFQAKEMVAYFLFDSCDEQEVRIFSKKSPLFASFPRIVDQDMNGPALMPELY